MDDRHRRAGRHLLVVTGALCVALWGMDRFGGFSADRMAVRWGASAGRAAGAVPEAEVAAGRPVLSLVVGEDDLHDPARGILSNVLEHGPAWERPGTVAFFDEGALKFATDVGVRVHGGGSRLTSERQGFRLYFRKRYGALQVPPGVLFGPEAQPIRRLVVHNDVRDRDPAWHLVNPIAYDIARAAGAIAPETLPARFYLNGEFQGMFVLTERVDEHFFAAHRGHGRVRAEQAEFADLWDWAAATRPLRMADVAQRVDLENLTRWFLAVAFCVTRDTYQSPGQFRDLTRDPGWFWVNWDMDISFRVWNADNYAFQLLPIGGPRPGRNPAEPRPTLLTALLTDDPDYRAYFAAEIDRMLNHRVTPAFLERTLDHYRGIATTLAPDDVAFLAPLAEFFARRPAFFRELTEVWLDTDPSQPLRVRTPPGVDITIDGDRIPPVFDGLYLPSHALRLTVARGSDAFGGWIVNGRPAGAELDLRLTVDEPTDVEVVGRDGTRMGFDEPRRPLRARESDWEASPPVWVPIPAGAFDEGCVPGDPDCDDDERVQHREVIERGFSMLATEVTVGQFAVFARRIDLRMPRQPTWVVDATHPVANVTWNEASAFCASYDGRLPTEKEWAYAARGGEPSRLFPWEGGFAGQANLQDRTGPDVFPSTSPVASFPPNGFGLFDMIGGVWEWTADRYSDGAELYAVRGGSWLTPPRWARVSARAGMPRTARHPRELGFRCVR